MDRPVIGAITGLMARQRFRRNDYHSPTAGVVSGYVQGNLAILPADLADDFPRFRHLNPKPCPLLGASDPGSMLVTDLRNSHLATR